MGRVKTYDEALRQRLLDEAGRLLAAEGISALTLRRVAASASTSTTAVYSLFGDKDQLLTAMYTEGFTRLGRALTMARRGGPLEALGAMGMAYRAAALRTPQLYGLMFGRPAPSGEAQQVADAAFQPLVDGVRACLQRGELTAGTAEGIATHLWAISHGMVSLELAGLLGGTVRSRCNAYRDALVLSAVPFLA